MQRCLQGERAQAENRVLSKINGLVLLANSDIKLVLSVDVISGHSTTDSGLLTVFFLSCDKRTEG